MHLKTKKHLNVKRKTKCLHINFTNELYHFW